MGKKILFCLFFFIIFLSGCNELVEITGAFLNRLNAENYRLKEILVFIKDQNNELIPNVQVSIIDEIDSTCIVESKFTNGKMPIRLNFPDEQINPIPKKSGNLIIITDHPSLGIYSRVFKILSLYENESLNCEFIIITPDSEIPRVPASKYHKFKKF